MRKTACSLFVGAAVVACQSTPSPSSPVREVVVASDSPTPNFSPAIRAGNLLFLSGKVGVDSATGELAPGGIGPETGAALDRISATLGQAGASMADVVACTVYLADMGEFQAMNEVYRGAWPGPPPTRTTVAVAGLAIGARVEITCTAAVAPLK